MNFSICSSIEPDRATSPTSAGPGRRTLTICDCSLRWRRTGSRGNSTASWAMHSRFQTCSAVILSVQPRRVRCELGAKQWTIVSSILRPKRELMRSSKGQWYARGQRLAGIGVRTVRRRSERRDPPARLPREVEDRRQHAWQRRPQSGCCRRAPLVLASRSGHARRVHGCYARAIDPPHTTRPMERGRTSMAG